MMEDNLEGDYNLTEDIDKQKPDINPDKKKELGEKKDSYQSELEISRKENLRIMSTRPGSTSTSW